MDTDSSKPWADLLASIVPDGREAGLLQALSWHGEAARAQWLKWTQTVGDPRRFFERDYLGRKGLLAFVSQRITDNAIDVGHDFATYARVAQVREELRSRIFIDTLHTVQDALDRAGLDPVLLNGAAYAFTVYPQPLVRHNHGIDLLLPAEQLSEAKRTIAAAGFHPQHAATLPRGGALETYRHGSGLELTLRPQLFLAPHVRAERAEFRRRCREIAVDGFRVRVLAPADRLCHTLGESASGPARRNLRWACDTYLLLAHHERPDFDRVISTATEIGTALPTAVLLEFFRAQLGVDVPANVIAALRSGGLPQTAGHTNLLLSTALRSSVSVDEFVKRARTLESLAFTAARFALFPSAEHIAYQQRPTAKWRVPFLYVARMGRLLLRPFRRLRSVRTGAS
jgi:hypothetical protein